MTVRVEHIGDATLYLGDMRKILPALGPFDALITDPPYKVTSGGFGRLEGGFSGWIKDSYDNKGAIVACDLTWGDWLPISYAALRSDAHAYIFSNDRNLTEARSAAEAAGFEFHRLLVWDKKTALPNRWYIQNCEFILFIRKGKAFQIGEPGTMALQSMFQRDASPHPTEKPVPLLEVYARNSTAPNESVLDPFMGSGSTGVACARLGRHFVGIELEERYFDIACERIANAQNQGSFLRDIIEKPKSQQGGLGL